VFVQTALIADELVPLATQPALRDGFRKILYHRRGYTGSRGLERAGSIGRDADDVRSLLSAMGIPRAHIVGVSYSGAVALQLAADAPECAQSLVVSEPPPVHTSLGPEFRAANERLVRIRHDRGVSAALEEFAAVLFGSDWRPSWRSGSPAPWRRSNVMRSPSSTGTSLPYWDGTSGRAKRVESTALCCTSGGRTAAHGSRRSVNSSSAGCRMPRTCRSKAPAIRWRSHTRRRPVRPWPSFSHAIQSPPVRVAEHWRARRRRTQ
jgi:pimeloyl-ACP methyl ester carboxylesterase